MIFPRVFVAFCVYYVLDVMQKTPVRINLKIVKRLRIRLLWTAS